MFLFARTWTSQMIMALLASDVALPTIQERLIEVLWDLLLLVPLGILLGQLLIRIAATVSVPKPLRQHIPIGIWTFLLQWLLADVLLTATLWSVSKQVGSISDLQGQMDQNSWGWNGAFFTFACRLGMISLGVKVGETFFPLALTGGIACGKSTVSKLLQEKNNPSFTLIDTDKIGHQILLPPWHTDLNQPDSLVGPKDSVYVEILETFGNHNGKVDDQHPLLDDDKYIDRPKLGKMVFGKDEERKKLNKITHGRIFKCLLKKMAQDMYFGNTTWVCAEIPLLFESGAMRYLFGISMCVACKPSQQLERLIKRNPELSKEDCQKRIDSQMALETKLKLADIIIWNTQDNNTKDGKTAPQLTQQIEKVCKQLKERAHGMMGLSFSQFVLLFSSFVVVSVSAREFVGRLIG